MKHWLVPILLAMAVAAAVLLKDRASTAWPQWLVVGPLLLGLLILSFVFAQRLLSRVKASLPRGIKAALLASVCVTMLAWGYYAGRPAPYFRRVVGIDAPKSIADLSVQRLANFGEGDAVIFTFRCSDAEAQLLASHLQLDPVRLSEDDKSRTAVLYTHLFAALPTFSTTRSSRVWAGSKKVLHYNPQTGIYHLAIDRLAIPK